MQSVADVVGEGNGFGVAEDLDGLAASVDNQAAIGAAGEVLLEVASHSRIENTVKVARQFYDHFLAVHCVSLRRKYLFNFWRSLSRARKSRDFTAAVEIPRIWAVSSVITLLRISLS
jgi:hypothetical protein